MVGWGAGFISVDFYLGWGIGSGLFLCVGLRGAVSVGKHAVFVDMHIRGYEDVVDAFVGEAVGAVVVECAVELVDEI